MTNATIYDVSQLANVSIATVSRVLNSPDQVSDKTRARVIQAIDELNFVPKFEAVARARKSLGRIGILTSTSTIDSFMDRLRGLFGALSDHAYDLVIYDVATNAQRDSYLASLPAGRQVDGLIIVDIPLDDQAQQRLLKYNLPTVQLISDNTFAANQLTTILHNDMQGGAIAASHLLEKGYRRFGYIGHTAWLTKLDSFKDHKLDSFRQTLALSGVALPDTFVRSAEYGMESGRRMMHDLLNLTEPPDAVFAGNDTLAIGAMRAIQERNLKIPDDVALLGFDNIAVAEYIDLTTIDQQLEESGRLAVDMLINQIECNDIVQKVELPFKLIERGTT